jgi:hypothetical protein
VRIEWESSSHVTVFRSPSYSYAQTDRVRAPIFVFINLDNVRSTGHGVTNRSSGGGRDSLQVQYFRYACRDMLQFDMPQAAFNRITSSAELVFKTGRKGELVWIVVMLHTCCPHGNSLR